MYRRDQRKKALKDFVGAIVLVVTAEIQCVGSRYCGQTLGYWYEKNLRKYAFRPLFHVLEEKNLKASMQIWISLPDVHSSDMRIKSLQRALLGFHYWSVWKKRYAQLHMLNFSHAIQVPQLVDLAPLLHHILFLDCCCPPEIWGVKMWMLAAINCWSTTPHHNFGSTCTYIFNASTQIETHTKTK